MYISIGKAAKMMGISASIMRKWEREGGMKADYRTEGGHGRYNIKRLSSSSYDFVPCTSCGSLVNTHFNAACLIRDRALSSLPPD